MQKWEYKEKEDLSEAELNQLGDEGWELVTVTATHANRVSGYIFYLKRSKS